MRQVCWRWGSLILVQQWSWPTPFGTWRRKGVGYEWDEALAPGLCPVLMETLLVIRSTPSHPTPLQLSSLASSTVAGKSATRGIGITSWLPHLLQSISLCCGEGCRERKKLNHTTAVQTTEQKAVPPCQAAQVPAAGMGPCGSLQGWQRSQGRNLAFSRTPGSVFLLSIFLNLTHILFFSGGREPHSRTFQRCVDHLVFQTSWQNRPKVNRSKSCRQKPY